MRRSLLFLPGNNPNMLANGDILGADAIILDLEDSVSPDEKDAARILVRNAILGLRYQGVEIVIRINPVDDTGHWRKDLDEVVPLRPHMILATKVRDPEYIATVSGYMAEIEAKNGMDKNSVRLIALIETAMGVENAFAIAGCDPRVAALFLGAEDLTADLRCERTSDGHEIAYARSRLVSAGRAAGVDIYDTPFTDVQDDAGILEDAKFAKSLGFSGKASISPRHVAAINRVFSPTPQEVEYAHEVLAAIEEAKAQGKGAVSLRGKMIDLPIVIRARQVLEQDSAIRKTGGTDHE